MEKYSTEKYRGYDINIYYDTTPENPRKFECNVATLVCNHPNYRLGDEHNIYEAVNRLFEKYVPPKAIIVYFCETRKAHQITDENGANLFEYTVVWGDGTTDICTIDADQPEEDIASDMASDFELREQLKLIEESREVVLKSIRMCNHSGISLWLGEEFGKSNRLFDKSEIGFVYVERCTAEKEMVLRVMPDKSCESWQEWAEKMMEGEVKIYNDYLTGNVFGYVIEDSDGYCEDSCWGFYGTDVIPEVIQEVKGNIDHMLECREHDLGIQRKILENYLPACYEYEWVIENTCYRIRTNSSNENVLESAYISDYCVQEYKPCSVNDLDLKVLGIMISTIQTEQN